MPFQPGVSLKLPIHTFNLWGVRALQHSSFHACPQMPYTLSLLTTSSVPSVCWYTTGRTALEVKVGLTASHWHPAAGQAAFSSLCCSRVLALPLTSHISLGQLLFHNTPREKQAHTHLESSSHTAYPMPREQSKNSRWDTGLWPIP